MNPYKSNFRLGTIIIFFFFFDIVYGQSYYPFQNSSLPIEERVTDLINQLTREEKISLFGFDSPGVSRLSVPKYNWWNEALHGVARAGNATVFPQAIGLAATFNDSLINEMANVISTEARAKYNLAAANNERIQYMGLTFWSPNINIFRDPRWGRGQETYGEDPYLTSQMGVAFVTGIQGKDPKYLKASACAKHFAVHSGPEANRHTFNAIVNESDLRETYLYAFKKLVDAGVESVMCAYNRVNDEPCCTSNTLIKNILLNEWNFKGHVVTDCWALEDIWLRHKSLSNSVVVAAEAIKTGVNLDCSYLLQQDLKKALDQGLLTEKDLDNALIPTLKTQFKLGFYDDPKDDPWSGLDKKNIRSKDHIDLARKVAAQSIVLLKNEKELLPLKKENYKTILVTGANATSSDALFGNYHGVSSSLVTFLEGVVAAVDPGTSVQYDLGCNNTDTTHFGGLWVSENSDITIAVIGLTPVYEGEEGDAFLAPNGGDKKDLSIPAAHIAFMKALRKRHNKPIVAVVTGGSDMDIEAIEPYANAVLLAWYPGEQGGNALADILFGKMSPSGRLPVTFYRSLKDLPSYDDYHMKGRTYRYFDGDVQYPFGFGLSYTSFRYSWVQQPDKLYSENDTIDVELRIKNVGKTDGAEVVQAYIQYPEGTDLPIKELKAFKRTNVLQGGEKTVRLRIPVNDLEKWDEEKGSWATIKGSYKIDLGSHSRDTKLEASFKIK